jgi:hypothetical protein
MTEALMPASRTNVSSASPPHSEKSSTQLQTKQPRSTSPFAAADQTTALDEPVCEIGVGSREEVAYQLVGIVAVGKPALGGRKDLPVERQIAEPRDIGFEELTDAPQRLIDARDDFEAAGADKRRRELGHELRQGYPFLGGARRSLPGRGLSPLCSRSSVR